MDFNQALNIDEEGHFISQGLRLADPTCRAWLENIRVDDKGRFITRVDGLEVLVAAFDEPLVARQVDKSANQISLHFPYDFQAPLDFSTLRLDQWDRFHGRTPNGVPFVLSRPAQAAFFNLLEEFDDTSVTFGGQTFQCGPWMSDNPEAPDRAQWWSGLYQTKEARWDLGHASPVLDKWVPRLKLPRSRVAVLGCGAGHDAAFFARAGHIVTGFDFSEEAVARAKVTYGDVRDLRFEQQDVFKMPPGEFGQFDIIFDHTFYCAVPPSRRDEVVTLWRKLLHDQGFLLGIFFAMDRPSGPPYGGSEWELRSRIQKNFRPQIWARTSESQGDRQGREFLVFAHRFQ